jgi:hypothetical protein
MGFFPSDYLPATGSDSKTPNEKYLETRHLKEDGESVTLRPCGTFDSGHVIAGWYYFTMEGQPRRFRVYPGGFESDIGLTYAGKTQGTGEKDRPKYFLSFVALCKERDDFVIVTFDKKGLREQFEEILSIEDYTQVESGMGNFFLTLKRKGAGLDTSWMLTPTLKAPTRADEKRWLDVKDKIWVPALYDGADPFAGKPSDGRPQGLPPTHRDPETGADTEVAVEAMPAAGW